MKGLLIFTSTFDAAVHHWQSFEGTTCNLESSHRQGENTAWANTS